MLLGPLALQEVFFSSFTFVSFWDTTKFDMDDLTCPGCGKTIQITQALMSQVTEQVKTDLQKKLEIERVKMQEESEKQKLENEKLKKSIEEQTVLQSKKLEEERKKFETEYEEKSRQQMKLQEESMRKKVEEEVALKQKDMVNSLQEKEEKLKKNDEMLLEMMKQLREKDEKERELRLDMEKRLGDEIKMTYVKVQKQMAEQYEMQLKERDKLNDDLRKKIEELQMKASESSVQIRGEIVELELESMLRDLFPMDVIEPIGKGKNGADVAQKVRDQYGRPCGVILWESKHTKNFMAEWLPKLREDLRTYKGHVAVLATLTMPDGLDTFGMKDGIWITNYDCLAGLATALRHQIIYVAYERNASSGKGEKMEMLYNYLIGHEFKQKIEAIVEAFTEMRTDLEKEKMVMEKVWKKREMQLTRMAVSTSRMYGEMQGLVGSALPTVAGLELEAGDNGTKNATSLLDLMN